MIKGINRAHLSGGVSESYFAHAQRDCIFISHKYEDLDAAREVAEYIKDYGVDVYLDDHDLKLQKAVKANNSEGIVSCIEGGLNASTHILVLVTEHTRMSWWVPYETGYAKMGKKGIASLLLKEADEFPDYLKIEATLDGFKDLSDYLEGLHTLTPVIESTSLRYERLLVRNQHRDALLRYMRG